MKRILTFVCLAALSLSMANASLLFQERFDRPAGTLSASTWSGGSIPSDGNWHTYSPGTEQFKVVAQQLTHDDYCTATTTNAVKYSANHSRDYILFENAVSSIAGNKAYLAFLLKVNAGGLQTSSSASSASNANNSIISFAIDASNNALGSLNGRVVIKTVDASTYNLGVSRRSETPQFAETALKTGTTYLIVVEYAFVEGEKNDLVSLYINPTPAEQTVAVTSVNPSAASADAAKLVGVALCSNGNTPVDMLLDEIKVAASWDDLWEDSSQPTPAIIAENILSFGNVTIGEPAEENITVKGENLTGEITVASDNSALVPAVTSIAKTDAETGYTLKLTLTAPKEGAGSANITLSSAGAANVIVVAGWNATKPVPPAGTELLQNGSFEDYSCNAMFGCSFEGWNFPLGTASIEENDKLDGDVALKINATQTVNLDQGVTLVDAEYAAGSLFEIKLHYKVLSLPAEGALALDCYWEPVGSGDAEAMKQHDADKLQRNVAAAVSTEWEELDVITSKPTNSSFFRVRFKVPKNAQVLFDDFSLVRIEDTEPYILVTPNKLSPVETTIGNTVVFQTLHVEQGNLDGATTFELSYTDADQFMLSQAELAADQSKCNLVVTYAPTKAGIHTAYLNIDNTLHPTLHQSIKLQGSCTDPSAQPVITVTPSIVPAFSAVAGQQQQQVIKVKSENCNDFIYLRVEHVTGAAFVIDGTMLSKNTESEVTVTFKPQEEGDFLSTLVIYSQSSEFNNVEVELSGTGLPATPETVDWATDFQWDNSHPLTLLDEGFDQAEHNKTLLISGWQNVAAADARPWWGLDESQTSLFDGDGKYAKATAYQFGKQSTGDWEMWLVTPALDYKNAEGKIFAFSVMGQYLPEEESPTALEIYYIDPYSQAEVFTQNLTASFSIPKTGDEDSQWVTFYLDLAPHAQTVADIFHMAFRYIGPNGTDGVVTYYIDDVSWGRTDLPSALDTRPEASNCSKLLRDGQLIIRTGNNCYSILGIRLR